MATNSRIEWTEATWNPVGGCTIISPGCTNCYAMRLASRLEKNGAKKNTQGLLVLQAVVRNGMVESFLMRMLSICRRNGSRAKRFL